MLVGLGGGGGGGVLALFGAYVPRPVGVGGSLVVLGWLGWSPVGCLLVWVGVVVAILVVVLLLLGVWGGAGGVALFPWWWGWVGGGVLCRWRWGWGWVLRWWFGLGCGQ